MWHIIAMGAGKCFSARVPAGDDRSVAVCEALAAAEDFAAEACLADDAATRLQVVIEELVTNALRHGKATQFTLELVAGPQSVDVTLEDDGAPFDPTASRTFAGPDAQTGGGVGLALIRAWSSSWIYSRRGAINLSELSLPI